MATSATQQAQERTVNRTAAPTPQPPQPQRPAARVSAPLDKKAIGYGLPCARCHAYFPADMPSCPICKSPERVSPTEPVRHQMVPPSAPAVKNPEVEQERERLLKDLKSQAFASHTQINPPTTFQCVLAHQHTGSAEPAAVCHTCYSDVRQQADRLEAALHMDVKDAAKIVYDAVWADTSDPNASYFNAAGALLNELRKRAGIGLVLGAHQPLAH